MSKAIPADRSKLSLPDLHLIAKETQLIIRESKKFTAGGFLQSLLSSVVTGQASSNQIAGELKDRTSLGMSRQSLHDRFDIHSTAFMMAVLFDLMQQRYRPAVAAIQGREIQRILIEDASSQVMPKSNSAAFAGHGNGHGETAGVKIDLAFDLLTGDIISHSLYGATEQDKTIGKEFVAEVRHGDLVLRDMGYFSLSEFTAIEQRGAWWLTRLPLTTGVTLEDGGSLENYLKRFRGGIIDLTAIVGSQGKRCRLVAIRAASEVTRARRAKRRKQAKACGKIPCPKGLIRDAWHIMLTNLDKQRASVSQLAAIYRARWAVEIQFRAWKQALKLDKALNRKSNEHHIQALVLAGMIAHQLGMKIAQRIGSLVGRARLSYEKLYDLLAVHLIKSRNLEDSAAFNPDSRHVQRDKRTRKSPVESGILALT
jgi:hypothetical protein